MTPAAEESLAKNQQENPAFEPDPRVELGLLSAALAAHLERRQGLGARLEPRVAAPSLAAPPQAVTPPTESPQNESPRNELSPAARAPGAVRAESARPPLRPAELRPQAAPALGPRGAELPLASENRARAQGCTALGELRALVAGCTACGLAKTRTQTVFSDGRDGARIMFIGEAPGQSEDEQGVPFVGAAGQLLTDIIQKGMGLARSQVYIANVLKCRPPGNRDPEEDEKALCTPFLDRQIELLNPELLIPLGLHASQHVLHSPLSMGRLRGRVHLLNGRKVVPTFHPAYLLRNPAAKKDCWQDIQLAMRELGIGPPARAGEGPARGSENPGPGAR